MKVISAWWNWSRRKFPVDDYQRGLVDFHSAAYAPGIEALQAYIDANPESYMAEAHLYLAWSYEALGDLDSANAELAPTPRLMRRMGCWNRQK